MVSAVRAVEWEAEVVGTWAAAKALPVMLTNNYLQHVLLPTTQLLSLVASYYHTFEPLFDLHNLTHNIIKCNCQLKSLSIVKHTTDTKVYLIILWNLNINS
jgi:hypothetical protein